MASDSSSWRVVENGRAMALLVHLHQRTYVLPWSLFLYAEGTDIEVRALFHTHVVQLQGAGLTSLLSELAAQVVSAVIEPERTAKFTPSAGSHLTAVSVSENK